MVEKFSEYPEIDFDPFSLELFKHFRYQIKQIFIAWRLISMLSRTSKVDIDGILNETFIQQRCDERFMCLTLHGVIALSWILKMWGCKITEKIFWTFGHSPLNLIKPRHSIGRHKILRHFVFCEASSATTVVGYKSKKYTVSISIPLFSLQGKCVLWKSFRSGLFKLIKKVTHFFLALRLHNIEYNLVIAYHHH